VSPLTGMRAALQEELKGIDNTLEHMAAKRTAILNLLELYGVQDEKVRATGAKATAARIKSVGPGSLDMARVVIRNAGRPLKTLGIREAIVKTYGVEPAKTLENMLWRHCRKEGGLFFKEEDGSIGVREMQAKVVTVRGLGNQSQVA
jgi:hypothetical protein